MLSLLLQIPSDNGTLGLLVLCLIAVCAFEFINGFHDTANAVATVIYTKALKPFVAVLWSGFWNFVGVWVGGIAVAMGIVKLLPVLEMVSQPISESIAIVLGMLLSAIVWNLGTWYFGIPCSSSHTLIGSILGVGIAFQYYNGGEGINWNKAADIGMSLLLSPAFGFTAAISLMFLMKTFIKDKALYKEPHNKKPPPPWIRAILITTCTLVSFFHGSNDGQKGVGLMMIVLMIFLPTQFALNSSFNKTEAHASLERIEQALMQNTSTDNHILSHEITATVGVITELQQTIDSLQQDDRNQLFTMRKRLQTLNKSLEHLLKDNDAPLLAATQPIIKEEIKHLKNYTDFAPTWVILLISLSLGIGTMVGWKRIVVTIGEKIGKSHLTYAQGAAAELIAASTIGLSTGLGLPVSTTHVLSSGIAGTMVASKGVKNLQKKTIINIALAWLLTLPVTILMAALFYSVIRIIL